MKFEEKCLKRKGFLPGGVCTTTSHADHGHWSQPGSWLWTPPLQSLLWAGGRDTGRQWDAPDLSAGMPGAMPARMQILS